jgi:hypothetical protein
MNDQSLQHTRGRFGAPVVFLSCLCATFVGTACSKKDAGSQATGPAASAARSASATPTVAPAASYTGPTGTVRGRIIATGDPPPVTPLPETPKCEHAKVFYGTHFRVSAEHGLGDAIVGVTEYTGRLPQPTSPQPVTIRNCAFDRRTYTLSKLQDLELLNRDGETYLPHLEGARAASLNVAVPGNKILLHTRGPGHYLLLDDMKHPWLYADVYVFAYPTHTVTNTDGEYVIGGIPVGKSKLSVVHPAIGRTIDKEIDIKAGETLTLDVEMPYDLKTDLRPAPPGSASARGSASVKAPAPPVPSSAASGKPAPGKVVP